MRIHLWCAVAVVLAVGCRKSHPREAYPVGSYMGGGSMFGNAHCTYDAPASVAQISENKEYVTLVGEGEIKETCKGEDTMYDVVKPTGAKIDGPDHIRVGGQGDFYRPVLVAGTRKLETYKMP